MGKSFGRIAGKTTARGMIKRLGLANTLLIWAAILIFIGLLIGVKMLLSIMSGSGVYVEDRMSWSRGFAKVVEMGDGYSVVERTFRGETFRANLYGTPGKREYVGQSVIVDYEKANPFNMARETWSFFNDGLSAVGFMLIGGGMLSMGLYIRKVSSKKKNVPDEIKRETEAAVRRELMAGEKLLCYCTMLNRTGWSILFIAFSMVPLGVGIRGIVETFGTDPDFHMLYTLGAVILSIFGLVGIVFGLIYLKKSSYKYCFVTDKRLCFRGKFGLVRDIDKKDIETVNFIPKHGLSVHDFITLKTHTDSNHGSKKLDFVPKFNAEEMAEALRSIIEPYNDK
jgi:hypothetical protein